MLDEILKNYSQNFSSETELDDNSSLKKMLPLVGEFKQVVDFGCATGYFANLLRAKGCQVTGVEISPDAAKIAEQYCEKVIVTDLDFESIANLLPHQTFDVAVFGDVLEHLRDPLKVLKDVRQILKPNGYVVASIPNIAHGAIRLALLNGKFEYTKLGILDSTHLRFFTRKTVQELFEQAGYFIEATDRTVLPIFSDGYLAPYLAKEEFPDEIIHKIAQEEDTDTLQFILRAFQQSSEGHFAALEKNYSNLLDEKYHLQAELHRSHLYSQQLQKELEESRVEVQAQLHVELERNQAQLQAELEERQNRLQQTQTNLEEAYRHLRLAQQQLQQQRTEFREVQKQLQQQRIELKRTQSDLKKNNQKSAVVETKLTQVEEQLCQNQMKLQETEVELRRVRSQIEKKQQTIQNLRSNLEHKKADLQIAQARITAMESSKFWKFRNSWLRLKRKLKLSHEDISPFVIVPPEQNQLINQQPESRKNPPQPGKTTAQPAKPKVHSFNDYDRWMQHNTPKAADLARMADTVDVFQYKPLISIIVPVFNTPEQFLREAIDSVLAQVYPHWELCIADDASTQPHVRQVLRDYAAKDDRIKVIFRQENGHISLCSNSALELATGEYIALLDHDDALPPEALYEVAFLLNRHPEADMVYSDEDKLNEDGKRCNPFFKPDWCPDSFLSRMYTCHFGVYRRAIVTEIGGFRTGYEGSQDYDLVLRFTEKTNQIFHIPKILYHWRIHSASAASGTAAKPYAYEAGERAIVDALRRRGEKGKVISHPQLLGIYTIRYQIEDPKLVSIIIPTKDLGRLLNQCLDSIFTKSTYPNYEVIVIDNGSTEPHTEQVISEWLNREPKRMKCYSLPIPFNYSKINNFAAEKATGDYLLFLNNDTEVIAPDWIEGMVEQAQRPSIGVVGARLLYPDDTIQHAGIVLGACGFAGHSHKFFPAEAAGYFSQLVAISNYSAVTGACLMCRREVFEAVGGFDETLEVSCNDVELCIRILDRGFRNIYLPHVTLYHHESKSRGYDDTPEKRDRFFKEIQYVKDRWGEVFEHDPCYNPNLTRDHQDYSLREPDKTEIDELIKQLRQTQKRLQRMETQLQQVEQEKDEAIGRVAAMETSKFWQMRKRWFTLKRMAGIPGED